MNKRYKIKIIRHISIYSCLQNTVVQYGKLYKVNWMLLKRSSYIKAVANKNTFPGNDMFYWFAKVKNVREDDRVWSHFIDVFKKWSLSLRILNSCKICKWVVISVVDRKHWIHKQSRKTNYVFENLLLQLSFTNAVMRRLSVKIRILSKHIFHCS